MRFLWVVRHPSAVRSLGGVFRLLDARGHSVHVAFGAVKTGGSHRVLQELAEECRALTFDRLPGPTAVDQASAARGWSRVAERTRLTADALRYLDGRYDGSPSLRRRGLAKAPAGARRLARAAGTTGPVGVRSLRAAVQGLERSLPVPPHVRRFVSEQRPDVLVATHLNEWAAPDADYLRAARRLGIHTAYAVFSWDNLTNKGLVRGEPELVLVWNDLQSAEAVELHGIPRERVRITGAPAYDHWFDWRPSTGREEFCRQVGLRADLPIVLYVCSSRFIAPKEVSFVRRWAAALRRHGGELADVGLLVRPHPQNAQQWRGAELDEPQVSVWPRLGEEPIGRDARSHYFDSIHHASAVVGINTSAQIESAIVGRPVHTVLADEFSGVQDGTLHFRYLHADDFGHLHVAASLEEHAGRLARSLHEPDEDLNARFLRRFVRPLGLDLAAAPLVAEALEELAARPAPAPDPGPVLAPVVQLLLQPVAGRAAREAGAVDGDRPPSPARALRRSLRALVDDHPGAPVVAGPWPADEIGELMYWIPFLAWAEAATWGLRERLVVLARAEAAPWYAGLGSRLLTCDELPPPERLRSLLDDRTPVLLRPELLTGLRDVLATEHPGFQRRLLGFARVPAPELPEDLDLPEDAVAVCFEEGADLLAVAFVRALAGRRPVVVLRGSDSIRAELGGDGRVTVLGGTDRGTETAILARAPAFAGSYGVLAYLAALLGRPSVALLTDAASARPGDRRLAADFLGTPPYGRLDVVETGGDERSAVQRAASLVCEAAVPSAQLSIDRAAARS